MSERLSGKVVAITGTGSGMGRAATLLFAREGAVVAGCDLDEATARETATLAAAEGLETLALAPIDLADRRDVTRWIDNVVETHGRLDVLYNNASSPRFGPFEEMDEADYRHTVVNELDVVWNACQVAWPHLARSGGTIVNVGSIAALIGTRDLRQAAHAATKGAVVALTRQLAAEGAAFGIRANCVSPGVVTSPPVQALLDELGDQAPVQPMIRAAADRAPGSPIDIAHAALFLASDEARWVNGVNLVVDGGATVII